MKQRFVRITSQGEGQRLCCWRLKKRRDVRRLWKLLFLPSLCWSYVVWFYWISTWLSDQDPRQESQTNESNHLHDHRNKKNIMEDRAGQQNAYMQHQVRALANPPQANLIYFHFAEKKAMNCKIWYWRHVRSNVVVASIEFFLVPYF